MSTRGGVWIHEERTVGGEGPVLEVVLVTGCRGPIGDPWCLLVFDTSHTPGQDIEGNRPPLAHTGRPVVQDTGDATVDVR